MVCLPNSYFIQYPAVVCVYRTVIKVNHLNSKHHTQAKLKYSIIPRRPREPISFLKPHFKTLRVRLKLLSLLRIQNTPRRP